jgi:cytochrome c oxidase subunit 2
MAALGLALAGTLTAELTTAVSNALFLVLLLLGGVAVAPDVLPGRSPRSARPRRSARPSRCCAALLDGATGPVRRRARGARGWGVVGTLAAVARLPLGALSGRRARWGHGGVPMPSVPSLPSAAAGAPAAGTRDRRRPTVVRVGSGDGPDGGSGGGRVTRKNLGSGERLTADARAGRRRGRTRLLATTALVLAACSGEQNALDPAGPFAQRPHDLILWVFGIAVVVFVLVQGLILYTSFRYRRREGDDSMPEQVHGNTKLEIVWTLIPAMILAAIAVPTVQLIFEQMDEPDEDYLTVEVIGHRWWFEYYYPDYDIYTANEMAIPVGVPVRLEMTATDLARSPDLGVIHSFWIPRLAGKQDLVPGHTTYLNLQADEPGRYLGQCAEYCGLSHVNMRARVEAMDMADFEAWVAAQPRRPRSRPTARSRRAAASSSVTSVRARPARPATRCGRATPRGPAQGPDLTHL